MKKPTIKIAVLVTFAALYSIGTVFLTPISFGIYQIRLADALLPLSMIFGIPSAIGFGLGCIVSNIYGGLGLIDIIGGTTANIIACSLAWYVAKKGGFKIRLLGSVLETFVIVVIVGGYLSLIFNVPIEFGLFGVLVGSIIAINILGFPIQEMIRKNKIIEKYTSIEKTTNIKVKI